MARLWDSHALAGVPTERAFLFLEVGLSYVLCAESSCGRLSGESGWCEAHARKSKHSVGEELASLREQVRTLTAERDAFTASLEREAQVADALRARVAEVEAENERLARHHAERVDERNAAQQRAKALVDAALDALANLTTATNAMEGMSQWNGAPRDHAWEARIALEEVLKSKEAP